MEIALIFQFEIEQYISIHMSIRPFLYIALLLSQMLVSCSTTKKTATGYKAAYIAIDSSIKQKQSIEDMLVPYRVSMDSVMNKIIGYSDMPLSKAQPECTLGNFMADAQLKVAKAKNALVKISIMNYGGIRVPFVTSGAITKGKIYEIMPFDNKLTIVDIPGKTLKTFCNHIAQYGGWPVAGLTFKIKDKQAIDILIDNEPLNEQLIYPTAVSDYIANGGDNCDFLSSCKKEYFNIFIRDTLIEFLEALQSTSTPLHVNLEKRISYAE